MRGVLLRGEVFVAQQAGDKDCVLIFSRVRGMFEAPVDIAGAFRFLMQNVSRS